MCGCVPISTSGENLALDIADVLEGCSHIKIETKGRPLADIIDGAMDAVGWPGWSLAEVDEMQEDRDGWKQNHDSIADTIEQLLDESDGITKKHKKTEILEVLIDLRQGLKKLKDERVTESLSERALNAAIEKSRKSGESWWGQGNEVCRAKPQNVYDRVSGGYVNKYLNLVVNRDTKGNII